MYMLLDAEKELVEGVIQNPRFRLVRLVRSLERRLLPYIDDRGSWQWKLMRRLRRQRRKLLGVKNNKDNNTNHE